MDLSVVIAAYNEAPTIEETIRRVRATETGCEIVVVDDGSTDGTWERLERLRQTYPDLKLLRHDHNRGKGAALRTGFQSARGNTVVIQDADLEYDPKDYPRLLQPLLEGKADVVYGSRFLGGPHRVLFFWHYVGNKFLTLLCNAMTNLNLTDMETGYKAFRRAILDGMRLRCNRFGFEPEFTAKVAKRRLRVFEVPISYYGRGYEEGKKITWRDGLKAVFLILWFRLFE